MQKSSMNAMPTLPTSPASNHYKHTLFHKAQIPVQQIPLSDGLDALLLREQCLTHLLTLANTYYLDVVFSRA